MYEETTDCTTIFEGRVIRVELLKVRLADGRISTREIVRHRGAVGVLAKGVDGRFLFVRQFRKAVEDYRLEITAGLMDKGERPEQTASRELLEETGCKAATWTLLGSINGSPGFSDEVIHLYFADGVEEVQEISLDHDETVQAVWMDGEEFIREVVAGRVQDGKTLAAWMLYEKIIEQC